MFKKDDKMISCRQARDLLDLHLSNDPSLSSADRAVFQCHLEHCPKCAHEYLNTKWILALVKEYWQPETQYSHTRRCRDHNWLQKTWIAVAAIIVIAISITCVLLHNSSKQLSHQNIVVIKNQSHVSGKAFAELVTTFGRQKLFLGQPVKSQDKLQEVLLGGMHRVVMNTDTVATFATNPQKSTDSKVHYDIQLARGKLYVEVIPGNPFTVRTDNAILNITGTKFSVNALPGRTELTLVKGSVRFGVVDDEDKCVNVTAGYCSAILEHSAPTAPARVDAQTGTKWARDFVMQNVLAHVQPELDEEFLDSIRNSLANPTHPDLDSIDYATWLEEKQDWFAKEFPWIFDIQKVLKEEYSIDADYIELLMISGDIWQFNYPRPINKPIAIRNSANIKRVADYFKVDAEELIKAIHRYSYNSGILKSNNSNDISYHCCPK